MKTLFLILILSLTGSAYAVEDWYCKDEALTRQGSVFLSCGLGEARTEGIARDLAFAQARREFQQICEMDSLCKAHEISVDPGRTTCEKVDQMYKCYRLLRFTIEREARR